MPLAVTARSAGRPKRSMSHPQRSIAKFSTRQEILANFDKNVAAARKALAAAKDQDMGQPWSLLRAGQAMFTLPRAAMVRSFVLNHMIHHRAILCVYLRLNDIPGPGMFGPSGDE